MRIPYELHVLGVDAWLGIADGNIAAEFRLFVISIAVLGTVGGAIKHVTLCLVTH